MNTVRRLLVGAATLAVALPAWAQNLFDYQGPDRMDRIVAAAKKEGALTLYTTIAEKDLPAILKPFEQKYGIKVTVWRAGTETPMGLAGHPVSETAYTRTVAGLRNAYENKVPLTFSTDADYWVEGKTRGEVCLEFLKVWTDAGIPNADTLRALTINGYRISETERSRGPLKEGFFADMIAMPGNPLEDLEALKDVRFVMKDGQVFKRDGVMTPAAFFNGGPVNGWRIR